MTRQLQLVHSKQSIEQQSLTIAKQVIFNAASNILYLRGLFPEEAFDDVDVCGVPSKKIRPGVSEAGILVLLSFIPGDVFLQWLEQGCFDALSKGYLKTIVLGIYESASEPTSMVETYTFNVTYKDGPEITMNGKKIFSHMRSSNDESEKAIRQLMRTLCVLMQTLEVLPDDRYLTMKLHYYDDVTPVDYDPPMFRSGTFEESVFLFNCNPTKLRIGKVEADRHAVDVKVYTIAGEAVNEDEMQDGLNIAPPVTTDFPEPRSHAPLDTRGEMSQSPDLDDNQVEENLREFNQDDEIKCSCNIKINSSAMIMCDSCKTWQHFACMGLISDGNDEHTENHICFNCRWPDLPFNSTKKLQFLCRLRRALEFIVDNRSYDPKGLKKYIGLTKENVGPTRSRLVEMGVLVRRSHSALELTSLKNAEAAYNDQMDVKKVLEIVRAEEDIIPDSQNMMDMRYNTQATVELQQQKRLADEDRLSFVPDSQQSMLLEMNNTASKRQKVSMSARSIHV